jgi:hypothetical protein
MSAGHTQDCTRSHPHENMDQACELRTEIARLTNEGARLKAANAELAEALDVLFDVFDDEQNNAPEHRCYVEGAWKLALNEARTALKKHKGEPHAN